MDEYYQRQLNAASARIDKQKILMDLQGVVTQGLWERVRELEKWKQDIDKLLFPSGEAPHRIVYVDYLKVGSGMA